MKTCGYIALLGRPNAGKSTLLNALVGDKLAVVSRKPQTTRNRILGVALEGEAQILFLDTPGLHKAKGKSLINAVMNRVALNAASEADLLVYLIDLAGGFTSEDARALTQALMCSKAPLLVLASKADVLNRPERAGAIASLSLALDAFFADEVNAGFKERLLAPDACAISAKRPEEVAALKQDIAAELPEGPWLFGDDDLTDMPRAFLCAELVREQLFRQLGQEIPYGTAVKLAEIEFKPELVVVRAKIVVAKKSHKPIVLGKGGAQIKAIGTAARESLESHFAKKVFLELSVGVQEGWMDDQRMIAELAHLSDPEMGMNAERP